EVVVWVDEAGQTIGIENHAPTATIPPAQATDLPPILIVPDPDSLLVPEIPTEDDPPEPENVTPNRKFGISYSPYNDDRTCKSQERVDKDMEAVSEHEYVRIYGIDCNQTETVLAAAKKQNMQVFAGIFNLEGFPDSLETIMDAAAGDWSPFHTIAIGNELVNGKHNSAEEVVQAVHTARGRLRDAGYEGPVVTVDTFSVMLKHPELCHASDYCAANCHAFFDANQTPEKAGAYARKQAKQVSDAAGGKKTLITESGWPHGGQPNGAAIPSKENQQKAISSLRETFGDNGDLVLFTAFDDGWKEDNQWTFGAEKFWGIQNP
ncbi:hypothetical protein ASPWEDRAFT_102180, partial [Aspergillus wentii DTO 134E9]